MIMENAVDTPVYDEDDLHAVMGDLSTANSMVEDIGLVQTYNQSLDSPDPTFTPESRALILRLRNKTLNRMGFPTRKVSLESDTHITFEAETKGFFARAWQKIKDMFRAIIDWFKNLFNFKKKREEEEKRMAEEMNAIAEEISANIKQNMAMFRGLSESNNEPLRDVPPLKKKDDVFDFDEYARNTSAVDIEKAYKTAGISRKYKPVTNASLEDAGNRRPSTVLYTDLIDALFKYGSRVNPQIEETRVAIASGDTRPFKMADYLSRVQEVFKDSNKSIDALADLAESLAKSLRAGDNSSFEKIVQEASKLYSDKSFKFMNGEVGFVDGAPRFSSKFRSPPSCTVTLSTNLMEDADTNSQVLLFASREIAPRNERLEKIISTRVNEIIREMERMERQTAIALDDKHIRAISTSAISMLRTIGFMTSHTEQYMAAVRWVHKTHMDALRYIRNRVTEVAGIRTVD